jgi:intracellular multiplication protein IcmQ
MDISIGKMHRDQTVQLELREKLLAVVKREKETLSQLLSEFYQLSERKEGDYARLNEKIAELMQRVMQAGDWESSLFLRNMVNVLKKRLSACAILKEEFEGHGAVTAERKIPSVPAEQVIVLYIGLYQTQGGDLKKWEKQLSSILQIAQSRPIYDEEAHVLNAIRSNLNRITDAYVKVIVNKNDIIHSAPIIKDRLGQELVVASATAIRPKNIVEFIHQRKIYNFVNGKLVLATNEDNRR